jgi:thiosulfate/3-mercaptopyruvate sulfurtransferase
LQIFLISRRFVPAALIVLALAGSYARAAAAIPNEALIQPEELAASMRDATAARPLILQVGFRKLYDQAHIPGAEYAGAASQVDDLRVLRERVAHLPRETAIVIYCGCCPWERCPNIDAAYQLLHALGFARLKALYIANDFGRDWVDKGYPVVKGA